LIKTCKNDMFSYYRKHLMKKYNLEKALIDADAINCVFVFCIKK